MTIRVVLADDQEIVRTGLRMILDARTVISAMSCGPPVQNVDRFASFQIWYAVIRPL